MMASSCEPLKNAKKKRLSAYLDPDVMNALADYSARRDVSLSLIAERFDTPGAEMFGFMRPEPSTVTGPRLLKLARAFALLMAPTENEAA